VGTAVTAAAHDVVVVGGGPVGLAAALYAVRSGLSAVVLEPRAGVVDKACGEGLMPGGVQALAGLGVTATGRDLVGIRYVSGGRLAEADFADGPGRGVRRTTLHELLRAALARAGGEVLPLAADELTQTGEGVVVQTRESGRNAGPDLSGRYLLAADGLHSPIRRALGLQATVRGPQRFGQRRHYGIPPWGSHVEVHWGCHGEAYVTPVADGLVGVAVLSTRRVPFAEQLADFPILQERLAGAPAATGVRGAGPLRQRAARRVTGRVLLVGDAGGYVDALTGEGISLGLAQARAAVAAVAADRPAGYEREWRRVSRRYAVLTHALVQATRPAWARRAVVPAAVALPAVFRAAVNELGRPQ
jgi:flavin-dependent dehydrogenase